MNITQTSLHVFLCWLCFQVVSEMKKLAKVESKTDESVTATDDKSKGDFGQSNPKDKDMYTTRSS